MEAKFQAFATIVVDIIWLWRLIQEFGLPAFQPTTMIVTILLLLHWSIIQSSMLEPSMLK